MKFIWIIKCKFCGRTCDKKTKEWAQSIYDKCPAYFRGRKK